MDDIQKPRHIRDIAHLYISRLAAKDAAPATRVFVVAVSRECFGAYHAANLGLGFASKEYAVELVEVSGVLPCSAYFLRLPPHVYVRQKVTSPDESLSALGRVSIRFSVTGKRDNVESPAAGVETGGVRRSKGRIDVYHLPPASDPESLDNVLEAALGSVEAGTGPEAGGLYRARAIVLAPKHSEAQKAARSLFENRAAVDWRTLSLNDRSGGTPGAGDGGHCLGYLAGWRAKLSDPLPSVVRDPGSHMSRSYLSICDALISRGSAGRVGYDSRRPRRAASLGQLR